MSEAEMQGVAQSADSPSAPESVEPSGTEKEKARPPRDGTTSLGDTFESVREQVIEVIKTCYDPEIPVDIWELGLIYNIDVWPDARVEVDMTLTSPMCPVAESLPPEVEHKIEGLPCVASCEISVIWEPPWTPEKMSEEAKLDLGFDDY